MLGIVFTEFASLVESRFGIAVLDRVIDGAGLAHDGGYTAVGYYPFDDLQRLLASLCRVTRLDAAAALETFGHHLFDRLREGHPQFFADDFDLFALLLRLDGVVHAEVRKLYPNATVPRFECTLESPGRLRMRYSSERGLADLAVGLLKGAAEHFGERITISRLDGAGPGETDFVIDRHRH